FLSVERLFKKSPPAARRFVRRGCELVAAGDQDNRQSWPGIPDDLLKRKSIRAGQANVRYYEVDIGDCRMQELLRRSEQSNPVTSRLQQIFERFKHAIVIVDHRHYRLWMRRHGHLSSPCPRIILQAT